MSVQAKPDGATGDLLFVLRDPGKLYKFHEVVSILAKAEEMGMPLEKGSYLECLTVSQLDSLVNDPRKCDA